MKRTLRRKYRNHAKGYKKTKKTDRYYKIKTRNRKTRLIKNNINKKQSRRVKTAGTVGSSRLVGKVLGNITKRHVLPVARASSEETIKEVLGRSVKALIEDKENLEPRKLARTVLNIKEPKQTLQEKLKDKQYYQTQAFQNIKQNIPTPSSPKLGDISPNLYYLKQQINPNSQQILKKQSEKIGLKPNIIKII